MAKNRRLWVPVVAAVVLGALIGPAGAADRTPDGRAVEYSVVLTGAPFAATNDDLGFQNDGYQVVVVGPSTEGEFVAPVSFGHDKVRIKKMVLWAYDNNGAGNVCATLYRADPSIGNDDAMGTVCSAGGTNGVRRFIQKNIGTRWVTDKHVPYLWLYIPGTYSSGFSFYGVQVFYTLP